MIIESFSISGDVMLESACIFPLSIVYVYVYCVRL